MTHDEYKKLLEKYELEKNKDMVRFEKRVSHFIDWGYVFFFGLILFFALLTLLAIGSIVLFRVNRLAIYLLIAAGAGLFAVLRIMFVKFPAPEGETVSRADAPELFSRLAELGQKLGAPPISTVRLFDDLNANAAAVPKYFLLGKPDLHVAVGVPLMAALAKEELDSVLAHELAHHTNRDSDVSLRVYRVMGVWGWMAETGGSWINWAPYFARWYYPRLSAMSDVLSRDKEFAADRMAAEATGTDVTARALMRMTFTAGPRKKIMADYIRDQAELTDAPIPDRTLQLLGQARLPVKIKSEEILAEARRESLTGDSHPTLRERLQALERSLSMEEGEVMRLAAELGEGLEETALDWYFGGAQSAIIQKIDADWVAENKESWKNFKGLRNYSREIVAEYEARTEPLLPRERGEYAYRLGQCGRKDEAVQYLEDCHRVAPEELPILRSFALSAIATEDPRTEELLDKLSAVPAFRFEADEHRYRWLQSQGKTQEAEAVADRLRKGSDDWYKVLESIMPWHSKSVAAKLPMTGVEFKKIRSILAEHKQVEAGYCAVMSREDLPGLTRGVLFITINIGAFVADAESKYQELASDLFDELDRYTNADVRILPTRESDAKKGAEKLSAFRIYSRTE